MKHFYRNGYRVHISEDGDAPVAAWVDRDGLHFIFNPIVDLLTGQVYETGEEYAQARALASAARKSETV